MVLRCCVSTQKGGRFSKAQYAVVVGVQILQDQIVIRYHGVRKTNTTEIQPRIVLRIQRRQFAKRNLSVVVDVKQRQLLTGEFLSRRIVHHWKQRHTINRRR